MYWTHIYYFWGGIWDTGGMKQFILLANILQNTLMLTSGMQKQLKRCWFEKFTLNTGASSLEMSISVISDVSFKPNNNHVIKYSSIVAMTVKAYLHKQQR